MNWRAAAIVALLVAGCSPGAAGHSIGGIMSLTSSSIDNRGASCSGIGGYSDMRAGAAVTVKNEAGTIIGTGPLRDGVFVAGRCDFPFLVTVPDAPFYSVEVGHRGALTYSRADLESKGWTVALTLGG